MDRRTFVAVVLCLVVFLAYPFLLRILGLEHYLRPAVQRPTTADSASVSGTDSTRLTPPPAGGETGAPPSAAKALGANARARAAAPPETTYSAAPERLIAVETPLYSARFSTRGARILGVDLKQYASARGAARGHLKRGEALAEADRVHLAGGPAFAVDLGSGESRRGFDHLTYEVAESLDASGAVRALTFTGHDPGGATVRQTYRIRPDEYAIELEVEIRDVPLAWRVNDYTLTTRSWPLAHENDRLDEERSLKASSLVGTNLHREMVGALRKGPRAFDGSVAWAGVQTRYFSGVVAVQQGTAKSAVASLDSRTLDAEERSRLGPQTPPSQDVVTNGLVVSLPGASGPGDRFVVYFGPNEYFRLARLGHGLERLVDLGWTWIRPLSTLLLRLLLWLNGLLQNYGVAIVALATLVRVLLHPLSMMSIKSMRAMQRLQPEIERIKEKYKKDPQTLNTAMMALYKDNKINPAGGCLPMLAQMPLFIGLYSVLFNAIELRQAPFVAWMQDLSAPDLLFRVGGFPLRLMPVIMAASGFVQQRVTPTDPRQATSFYLMNVMMLVFFYNLPSGLVLYWTVMNLLTALQQWIALREDGTHAVPASQMTGRGTSK